MYNKSKEKKQADLQKQITRAPKPPVKSTEGSLPLIKPAAKSPTTSLLPRVISAENKNTT